LEKFEYLKSINADYIEELFERYRANPSSVDDTWRYFFEGMELNEGADEAPAKVTNGNHAAGATAVATDGPLNGKTNSKAGVFADPGAAPAIDFSAEAKVAALIAAYRESGRLLAKLDPLSDAPQSHPLLDLSNFGLSPSDLTRQFTASRLIGMETAKLADILARLRETYCGSIGVEFTHIQDPVSRQWLLTKMESTRNRETLDVDTKKRILKRLTDSETFERFLHTRFVAKKRFSIEGGEALIPSLDRIIECASEYGARRVVVGMAHRGRLNVLVNTFGKKAENIFTEFEENFDDVETQGLGDVKYHMGFSCDLKTGNGKSVHLTMAHNPSHLEFVNPVVEGIVRSKQRALKDKERSQVVPLLIHGDAAFAGQGVVYETLNLSQVTGYRTGGTVHVVINNQVGFTTDPSSGRSTTYATDVAKMLEVPIFHVNGDDAEAVWFVSQLCTEFRQQFKKDVVIDLICYRKYGHNEGDEPSYTQPLMYSVIKTHPSPREVYLKRLLAEGVVTETEAKAYVDEVNGKLTADLERVRASKPKPFVSAYEAEWTGFRPPTSDDIFRSVETGVKGETLLHLAEKLHKIPEGFKLHPKLEKFRDQRFDSVKQGKGIDWGTGEALAYASLLDEGHPVRLSGQDCERGTFTHRQAVYHDVVNGSTYTPLNHLSNTQGEFMVFNSTLSETAVLGFEYGWSLADPNALVLWEAQFGDFVNGAQVIVDQFIMSGETKWQRSSGLVLLLPHGYEGQGPEHSSARLERFLQSCGEKNVAVCNFTTPAQVFHALRRQVKRPFRKPMIVMSPKSLLRHAAAVSKLEDFTESSGFQPVLDDPRFAVKGADASRVERVVLCSGKIYYELEEERANRKLENVAILRVEQLFPWPAHQLAEKLGTKYAKAKKIVWAQEEPRNMGAWTYVFSHWAGAIENLQEKVGGRSLEYVGRAVSATPAEGSYKTHVANQKKILNAALTV
jgi:2-oxoglutarate dehydrogenase E1 component